MKKMWIALSILAVAAALVLAGCQATRAGYESAPYKVVRSD
jgi:predicted small secreted protein